MSRAKIVLTNEERRVEAAKWISNAPVGTGVEFTPPGDKRSLEQNSRMWALFEEISQQLVHCDGRKYNKEEWCDIFWDGFRKEVTMVPDLYGIGVVSLRRRTSGLKVSEMTAFMEFILSEAIPRGVRFRDDPIDHLKLPRPIKGAGKMAADILNEPVGKRLIKAAKEGRVIVKGGAKPKLTRAEVMAKARAAKAAKAAEKPAGKASKPIVVEFKTPPQTNPGPPKAKPKPPATTQDYMAYAQAQILANRGKVSPAIMETWFMSDHEKQLREDCKVGQLVVQMLHSLIKESA